MKTGTLVKNKVFTLEAGRDIPEDIYRYGLIMPLEDWFIECTKDSETFCKVMWQPCESYIPGKRSYVEYCKKQSIEVVSEQR